MNIIKYARPQNSIIELFSRNKQNFLKVEDDGIGFDQTKISKPFKNSFGLYNIKKRFEILGGTFKIISAIGKGTTVIISIPDTYCKNEDKV